MRGGRAAAERADADARRRAALQRLAALRQDEAAKRATVDQLKAQQAAVLQDEDRIRRNLAAVRGE